MIFNRALKAKSSILRVRQRLYSTGPSRQFRKVSGPSLAAGLLIGTTSVFVTLNLLSTSSSSSQRAFCDTQGGEQSSLPSQNSNTEGSKSPRSYSPVQREVTRGTRILEENNLRNRLTHHHASSDIGLVGPPYYDFVVIGCGTAAQVACELLLEAQPSAKLLIVADIAHRARPDVDEKDFRLSSQLQGVFDRWRRPLEAQLPFTSLVGRDIVVSPGFAGVEIDPEKKLVHLREQNNHNGGSNNGKGSTVSYGQCLLAPSGKIRSHYVLDSKIQFSLTDFVNPLKHYSDFERLQQRLDKTAPESKTRKERFVVLGGGFLGTEMSSALAVLNHSRPDGSKLDIVQVFFEDFVMDTYIPRYLAEHLTAKLAKAGVSLRPNRLLAEAKHSESSNNSGNSEIDGDRSVGVSRSLSATLVNMSTEQEVVALDYLLLATTRVDPSIKVAQRSALEIDTRTGGVLVDSALEAFRDLFVAGSAASFFNQALGRRRVSNYDHAINTGLLSARNMLASSNLSNLVHYNHQPAFSVELAAVDTRFHCVGEIDSKLKTVGVWLAKRDPITGQPMSESDLRRGVVYYLKNSKIVGVLCVNAGECLEFARDVINQAEVLQDDAAKQLKKKIKLGPDYWLRIYTTK